MTKTRPLAMLIAAFLLLFAATPPTVALAYDDLPELELVTVYGEEVAPGNSLTVGADIWDRDGIEQAILQFADDSGYTIEVELRHTMGYGDAGERYSGKLQVPADAPEGDYRLVFASVLDKTFARSRYYPPGEEQDRPNSWELPEQPGFTITATAKAEEESTASYNDSHPPQLQSVTLLDTELLANGGTRYLLQVTATDTAAAGEQSSEVAHITVRLRNDRNNRTLSRVFSAKDCSKNNYTAWLEVDPYEPSGSFVLDSVTLTDRAFNTARYCRTADLRGSRLPLPGSLTLRLTTDAARADTVPPVLTGVTLGQTELETGGRMTVSAIATDDLAGVKSVSLQLRNGEGKSITVLLTDHGNGSLSGAINSYQTGKTGCYTLVRASVVDRAGNRRSYYQKPPVGGNSLPFSAAFSIYERS